MLYETVRQASRDIADAYDCSIMDAEDMICQTIGTVLPWEYEQLRQKYFAAQYEIERLERQLNAET